MDKWETTFKSHQVIEKFPTENGIDKELQYLYIKMPMFMTDRDLVRVNYTWNEYNGNPKNMLVYNTSTTNSKYPPKEKPIRAEMIIGGMYLKEVSDNETLVYMINNFDLKITTGKSIVDKLAPQKGTEFFPNLIKYIESKK